MERPSEHGGGRRGPAIAGDPTSFPSDAELARTLTAGQRQATLCTLTADGYPYGSVVSYAADGAGAPLLLISELAEHTANARGDDRVRELHTEVNVDRGSGAEIQRKKGRAHGNTPYQTKMGRYLRRSSRLTSRGQPQTSII